MNTEIPTSATSPQDFKKKRGGPQLLELPSGAWVKAKKVDLASFIQKGNIPNALLGIVNDAIKSDKDFDPAAAMEEDLDLETIRDMYNMIDEIVIQIVVDPQVHPLPTNEADRQDSLLYIDELDGQDKMYLFQWSNGTVKDLETFREQSNEGMDSLEESSSDGPETESVVGSTVG